MFIVKNYAVYGKVDGQKNFLRKIEDRIRQVAKGKYYTARQYFLEALKEINDVDFKAQIYLSIANRPVALQFDKITLGNETSETFHQSS